MDKKVEVSSSINEAQMEEANKGEEFAQAETFPSDDVTKAEKRLLRKIDLRVLPIPILLVGLSSIDRVNISSAKVAGMDKDLDLGGTRYNVVVLGRLLVLLLLCQ